jgi:hypothetical protein
MNLLCDSCLGNVVLISSFCKAFVFRNRNKIFKLINIDGIDSGFLKIQYTKNYNYVEIKGVNHLLYPFIAENLIENIHGLDFINDYDPDTKYYFYEQNTGVLSKMLTTPKYQINVNLHEEGIIL